MKLCFLLSEEMIFLMKQNVDSSKIRDIMLTSIILETKQIVTTLFKRSSFQRDFPTFKYLEKALSKSFHYIRLSYIWKLGMAIVSRILFWAKIHFGSMWFKILFSYWQYQEAACQMNSKSTLFHTNTEEDVAKILLMKLSVKIIRVTKIYIRNLQKYIVELSFFVLGHLLWILKFTRCYASRNELMRKIYSYFFN